MLVLVVVVAPSSNLNVRVTGEPILYSEYWFFQRMCDILKRRKNSDGINANYYYYYFRHRLKSDRVSGLVESMDLLIDFGTQFWAVLLSGESKNRCLICRQAKWLAREEKLRRQKHSWIQLFEERLLSRLLYLMILELGVHGQN